MKENVVIIGLGHKARNGKDYTATYMSRMLDVKGKNNIILHWADDLYKELENKPRKDPLIKVEPGIGGPNTIYSLLDRYENGKAIYQIFVDTALPMLHDIMVARGITEYWGMDEKDGPMLQFWGTDYRRRQNNNYWIDKIIDKIDRIAEKMPNEILYVFVPDTRFPNEADFLLNDNDQSFFIEVERYNADGTRFIATDRDPNHISETGLDKYIEEGKYDFIIRAKSGDTTTIEIQADRILSSIIAAYESAVFSETLT